MVGKIGSDQAGLCDIQVIGLVIEQNEVFVAIQRRTVFLEFQAPQITSGGIVGTPGSNGWYVSTVQYSASASDATSGLASFMINVDGTQLERITYHPLFDSFPMFSRDGRKLVWASNRNQKQRGETNIFVADWLE